MPNTNDNNTTLIKTNLFLCAEKLGIPSSEINDNINTKNINQFAEMVQILDDYSVNMAPMPVEFLKGWIEIKNGNYSNAAEMLIFPHEAAPMEAPANINEEKVYHSFYREDEIYEEGCALGKTRMIRAFISNLSEKERKLFLDIFSGGSPNYRPIQIVIAERALLANHYKKAADILSKTISLYYDDVYVQRLFLHATGQEIKTLHLQDKFCEKPFKFLDACQGGEAYLCNKSWLPISIGNFFHEGPKQIWNSEIAQKIRKSILDGSYRYCSPMACPLLTKLPKRTDIKDKQLKSIINNNSIQTELDTIRRVGISYDRSCNLQCPSCRNDLIVAKGEWKQQLEKLGNEKIIPLLKKASVASITGSGDAFGSKHHLSILKRLNKKEFPNLKLHIMTNGQLLTPKMWDSVPALNDMIDVLFVSIDGATKKTYEKLRLGGNYERICENMKFIGRKRKELDNFRLDINVVVQEENFEELKYLISMAKEWNVDIVTLYRLRQWGTYSSEEYLRRDIYNPNHPRHNEFVEYLKDPVFREPIVQPWDTANLIPPK